MIKLMLPTSQQINDGTEVKKKLKGRGRKGKKEGRKEGRREKETNKPTRSS